MFFCSVVAKNVRAESHSSITPTSITNNDSTGVSPSNLVSGVTGCFVTSMVKSDTMAVVQPVEPAEQDFIIVDETCAKPSEKSSTLCLKNTLDICNLSRRFWIFIIFMFSRKQAIGRWYIFPPHLTSASALHCKSRNTEIIFFTLVMCSTLQDFNQSMLDLLNLDDSQYIFMVMYRVGQKK